MRIRITTLFIILGLLSSAIAYAQPVSDTAMPMISKETATWCGPCGSWGWTAMTSLWDNFEAEAILFQRHNSASSKLHVDAASEWDDFFETNSGVPTFYFNNAISNTSRLQTLSKIQDFNDVPLIANSGYTLDLDGNTLTVNTNVKFFMDTQGEYTLGVYLTEHNVVEYQNGQGNDAVHKNPLRDKISTDIMGDLITSGSVTAGTEFPMTYMYEITDPSWKKNDLRVFTVVYKKVGTSYEYIAGWEDKSFQGFTTGTNDISFNGHTKVSPNILSATEYTTVKVDLKSQEVSAPAISVYNMNGQLVIPVQNMQNLGAGTFQYQLPVQSLSAGQYFIKYTENGSLLTTDRLIVQ